MHHEKSTPNRSTDLPPCAITLVSTLQVPRIQIDHTKSESGKPTNYWKSQDSRFRCCRLQLMAHKVKMLESAWGAQMSADCDATSMPKTFGFMGGFIGTPPRLCGICGRCPEYYSDPRTRTPCGPQTRSRGLILQCLCSLSILLPLLRSSSFLASITCQRICIRSNAAISGLPVCKIGIYLGTCW